jgi:hypothetical protein
MRRSPGAPARALLIALLSGASLTSSCGPDEGRGLEISFSSAALLDRAAQVAVYFYTPETACQLIRQTMPRPPSVLGPFSAPVTPEGKERGISFQLDAIPVGEYVVFVDALDENGANVGTGCAPGQRVLEKELSQIRVEVSEESS